jgi:hypothetical protein
MKKITTVSKVSLILQSVERLFLTYKNNHVRNKQRMLNKNASGVSAV